MNIQDFTTRWALHYVNPDFLKIPFSSGSPKRNGFVDVYIQSDEETALNGRFSEYIPGSLFYIRKINIENPETGELTDIAYMKNIGLYKSLAKQKKIMVNGQLRTYIVYNYIKEEDIDTAFQYTELTPYSIENVLEYNPHSSEITVSINSFDLTAPFSSQSFQKLIADDGATYIIQKYNGIGSTIPYRHYRFYLPEGEYEIVEFRSIYSALKEPIQFEVKYGEYTEVIIEHNLDFEVFEATDLINDDDYESGHSQAYVYSQPGSGSIDIDWSGVGGIPNETVNVVTRNVEYKDAHDWSETSVNNTYEYHLHATYAGYCPPTTIEVPDGVTPPQITGYFKETGTMRVNEPNWRKYWSENLSDYWYPDRISSMQLSGIGPIKYYFSGDWDFMGTDYSVGIYEPDGGYLSPDGNIGSCPWSKGYVSKYIHYTGGYWTVPSYDFYIKIGDKEIKSSMQLVYSMFNESAIVHRNEIFGKVGYSSSAGGMNTNGMHSIDYFDPDRDDPATFTGLGYLGDGNDPSLISKWASIGIEDIGDYAILKDYRNITYSLLTDTVSGDDGYTISDYGKTTIRPSLINTHQIMYEHVIGWTDSHGWGHGPWWDHGMTVNKSVVSDGTITDPKDINTFPIQTWYDPDDVYGDFLGGW